MIDLIKKYENDFSTDKAYGQMSVVDILKESIAELMSSIPEINNLSGGRKEDIEGQLLLFALGIYDDNEVADDNDGE
jgi:hypothetical protein